MKDKFLLLEAPFLSGTSMDDSIGKKATGGFDVGRLRSASRALLGIEGASFSLGRLGRVSIEAAPVFACVQTARRWSGDFSDQLAGLYVDAGLPDIASTPAYQSALESLEELVRKRVREEKPSAEEMAGVVGFCAVELMTHDAQFRDVAESLAALQRDVARKTKPVTRIEGHVERIEGEGEDARALVVERVDGRQTLKEVPLAFLRSVGLAREGADYVRTELRWTGDVQASLFQPALRIDPEDEQLDELDAAVSPLPEPPAEWPRPARLASRNSRTAGAGRRSR